MKIVKWLSAALLSIPLVSVQAGELRLDYSDFYSHLRKLDDEELQPLHFAFGFLNVQTKELCQVQKVMIDTDKMDIPVDVMANNRFVLPTEKALKLAKARLNIQLLEPENRCDLSVLLEAKPEMFEDGLDSTELLSVMTAFEGFFDKMGGFLSFMMPSATGLQITFTDPESIPDTFKALSVSNNGRWNIDGERLAELPQDFILNGVERITALTK